VKTAVQKNSTSHAWKSMESRIASEPWETWGTWCSLYIKERGTEPQTKFKMSVLLAVSLNAKRIQLYVG
jgi:hypothetical protein